MGMDVYGVGNPDAYFRANVWSWHPIWDCTMQLAPWASELVIHGHTNDGDGLGATASKRLAADLAQQFEVGAVEEWAKAHKAAQDAIPDEPCKWCNATGTRTDAVGIEMGHDKKWCLDAEGNEKQGWCNGCDGKGHVRPWSAAYGFDLDHFEEWIKFLRECQGFEIH